MPSVVVNGAPGPYRESGDVGWERWQQAGPATASPGWFAYTLNGLTPQTLHMFEFDYPDDKERTFAVAIRESDPLSYPVAGGVDSGGAEFRSSLAFQSQRLLFWPRSREARALFITNRDGMTAAASAARLYRVESSLPPLLPPGTPGRRFINWFEEGSNFLSMYGAAGSDLVKSGVAVERWAESAAYMGISTLMPTVSIYSFVLYPSQVNRAFSRPWDPDLFRQIMLTAERHGLEVIPEIHPRADELTWLFPAAPSPRPNVLVSRSGEVSTTLPTFFNPLHPDNQKWYLDVIGELVDNYRDSPALKGISLRMMGWSNPTLHNFHSLDWGYDDLTTGLFSKETGLAIPVRPDSPTRFSERYRWLMTNARARWIDWRSDKVAQLLTRVRDRVRKSRPDLIVYLNVFPLDGRLPGVEWMRDAGLDVEKLSRIDGLVMINSMHAYGRRFGPAVWGNLRRNLLDPAIAKHLTRGGSSGHYLPTSLYFEAMDNVVPPDQLGFPASTRRTWMSAVINPAGRNYLERFAMLLADGDALTLGDGGNAYSLGQPELREFLREYRRLPALAFTRRSEPDANVAVWSRAEADGQYFYLVNRTPVTQQISLPLAGAKTVLRLGTSVDEAATAGQLRVELKPFQLQAYRAAVGVSIPAVVETSRPRPGAQR
jgi:hypothetical protein